MGVTCFWACLDWWICGGPEERDDESRWLPEAVEDTSIPKKTVMLMTLLVSSPFIIQMYRKVYVGLDTHKEGRLNNENDSEIMRENG